MGYNPLSIADLVRDPLMPLCTQCAELLKEGGGPQASHAGLIAISDGGGTVGGRKVEATLLECSHCKATWQRETDVRTLKEIWYLKAGS